MNKQEFIVREANLDDSEVIVELVKQLGKFEGFQENDMPVTVELIKENVFQKGYCKILIAETNVEKIGLCSYYFTFSLTRGKPSIMIEDFYVIPPYRRKGVGLKLIKILAEIAVKENCESIEWACLKWNKGALDFYKSIGSKILETPELFSIEKEGIIKINEDFVGEI